MSSHYFLLTLCILGLIAAVFAADVSPSGGSLGGGTLIFITVDNNLGVEFPGVTPTVLIGSHKAKLVEYYSTTTRLAAITPEVPEDQDGVLQQVTVVNTAMSGAYEIVQFPDAFTYRADYTPRIESLSSQSVGFGDEVTIGGRMLASSLSQISSAKIGDYNLEIAENGVNWGSVTGIVGEIPAGYYNVTVTHDNKGSSYSVNEVLAFDNRAELSMIEVYADVQAITPAEGGSYGGTTVTLLGRGFDSEVQNNKVAIGGIPCDVVFAEPRELRCITGAGSGTPVSAGTRGLRRDFWFGVSSVSDLEALASYPDSPDGSETLTGRFAGPVNWNTTYGSRIHGFFKPPANGDYRFYIAADDSASLRLSTDDNAGNVAEIASVPSHTAIGQFDKFDSQQSAKVSLVKGNFYFIEALHAQGSGDDHVEVGFRFLKTKLTSKSTKSVVQEEQTLKLSTVTTEGHQKVSLSSTGDAAAADVQTITLSNADGGSFRLTIDDEITGWIPHNAAANTVQSSILGLTLPHNGTVEVTVSSDDTTRTYTVTTTAPSIPAYPAFEVYQHSLSSSNPDVTATITITHTTQGGSGSTGSFKLNVDGSDTADIPVGATAKAVKKALLNVIEPSLTPALSGGEYDVDDFELGPDSADDWVGGGNQVVDTTAYTGAGSLFFRNDSQHNWGYNFQGNNGYEEGQRQTFNTKDHPYVCFAYRISERSSVGLLVHDKSRGWRLIDITGDADKTNYKVIGAFEGIQVHATIDLQWHYTCANIDTMLDDAEGKGSHIITAIKFIAPVYTSLNEFHIDTFSIRPPVDGHLSSLKVTRTNIDGGHEYDISYDNCGWKSKGAALPQIAINAANLNGNNVASGVQQVETETFGLDGPIALGWGGSNSSSLSSDSTAAQIQAALEGLGTGTVEVTKYGNCFGYNWDVTFVDAAGDVDEVFIDDSALTGPSALAEVKEVQAGGANVRPIPGAMTRVPVDNTLVVDLSVNGVPSSCSASGNCEFALSASGVLGAITGVSPTTGNNQDEIVITGTGFSSTPSDNTVLIGTATCFVTDANSTALTCSLISSHVAGTYPVRVWVAGTTGQAAGSVDFTYELRYSGTTAFNPSLGSITGGSRITLEGDGFSKEISGNKVILGGTECQVVEADPTIVCIAGPHEEGEVYALVEVTNANGEVALVNQSTPNLFTYDQLVTPVIHSVNPPIGSIHGGTKLTLIGSGFNADNDPEHSPRVVLQLNGAVCELTFSNNTRLECTTKNVMGAAGTVTGKVTVDDHGSVEFDYTFGAGATPEISSLTPTEAALDAPLPVRVEGSKFGSDEGAIAVHLISVGAGVQSSGHHIHGASQTPTGSESSYNVDTGSLDANGFNVTLPPLPAGLYQLAVHIDGSGRTLHMPWTSLLTVGTITPSSGSFAGGTDVVITGTGLSAGTVLNWGGDGGAFCHHPDSSDATTLSCTTKPSTTSSANVMIMAAGQMVTATNGFTRDASLTPQLESVSPNAGTQLVTSIVLSGSGFGASGASVSINGAACSVTAQDDTSLTCTVGASLPGNYTVEVIVPNHGKAVNGYGTHFNYDADASFRVTSSSKDHGSTMGGTSVTLDGQGFGINTGDVTVTVAGVEATIDSLSDTEIQITTGMGHGTHLDGAILVNVNGKGVAYSTGVQYSYQDVWSATTTWGGNNPPVKGESVVIPADKTVYLDVSPPDLELIVVYGKLIFDDNQDLKLSAKWIIIQGGEFHVGSESAPFTHNAVIELRGDPRTNEIPVYGAKVIAVRGGVLHLFGQPKTPTWTRLTAHANIGATTIDVEDAGNWQVGDEIVIASSSNVAEEAETRVITGISGNTLTFSPALSNYHWGEQQTYSSNDGTVEGEAWGSDVTMETRAEVGLLTRNVKIEGDGLSPIFKYGAHVMIHDGHGSAVAETTSAKISHVEFYNAGQAFRLGRYPVHWHMNGDNSGSYIKGAAIHQTYNRAITVHGTHGLLLQDNVAYDNMGHTYFLEDGIETNNVFERNIGFLTKPSHSMLNTDTTPATFWITHPHNEYRNNVAAGNTAGYGFWMQFEAHPTGLSKTNSVCPRYGTLIDFSDNLSHSNHRYGLRVFPEFFPRENECGGGATVPTTLYRQTSYMNNRNGVTISHVSDLRLEGFKLADNRQAGIEWTEVTDPNWVNRIVDFTIVGRSPLNTFGSWFFDSFPDVHRNDSPNEGCSGIWGPKSYFLIASNVRFHSFAEHNVHCLTACSMCKKHYLQGGFEMQLEKVSYINSPEKVRFRWEHEGVFKDLDGTFTPGFVGAAAIPDSVLTVEPVCASVATYPDFNGAGRSFGGRRCDSTWSFRRIGLNEAKPNVLQTLDLLVTRKEVDVTMIVPWTKGRLTHPKGYMFLIPMGFSYDIAFDHFTDAAHYKWASTQLAADDHYYFEYNFTQEIDHVDVTTGAGGEVPVSSALPAPTDPHGSHYFSESEVRHYFLGNGLGDHNRKNNYFRASKCPDEGCPLPPTPANWLEPGTYYWSDPNTWKNSTNPSGQLPTANQDVYVHPGIRLIVDIETPVLNLVTVVGTLEFSPTVSNVLLAANIIFNKGGSILAGSEGSPLTNNVTIQLHGTRGSDELHISNSMLVGAKAIANFGLLSLHGANNVRSWSQLNATALPGATTITVDNDISSWRVGNEIVIASSQFNPHHDEIRRITAISGQEVSFAEPLVWRHQGELQYFDRPDGRDFIDTRAEVGLLSRNVVIEGANIEPQLFGAQIVLGTMSEEQDTDEGRVTVRHIGSVKVDGIECRHCGQLGYNHPALKLLYAAHPVAFTGDYVKNSAFNHGYDIALYASGANGFTIHNNVFYQSITDTVKVQGGENNVITDNLALKTWAPAGFGNGLTNSNTEDKFATFTIRGKSHTLTGNHAAGSDRQGFESELQQCGVSGQFARNTAHSNLLGILIPEAATGCLVLDTFTSYKAWDFGVFGYVRADVIARDLKVADSNVGVNINIVMPRESVQIQKALIVGQSDNYNCQESRPPNRAANSRGTGEAASGLMITSFTEGFGKNGPPYPWNLVESYPYYKGIAKLNSVHFANFDWDDITCPRTLDAIQSNNLSPDACHQVELTRVSFTGTGEGKNFRFHRPDPSWRNQADCGDMDCDGLKHCLVKDMDGSVTGEPESTFLAAHQGWIDWIEQDPLWWMKLMPNQAALQHQGVMRFGCRAVDGWPGYVCPPTNHEMLVIESLDADTETRRIAPTGLSSEGFTDILNGPMDHGWCFGHTCQLRKSSFWGVVVTGKEWSVDFTGSGPDGMRLTAPNMPADESIRLNIWYNNPNRKAIYVNGQELEDSREIPALDAAHGTFHFHHLAKRLYVVLKGSQSVTVKTTRVIQVSMRIDLDINDFFVHDFITNIAFVLRIDPATIRVVDIRPGSTIVDFDIEENTDSHQQGKRTFEEMRTTINRIGDKELPITNFPVMAVLSLTMPEDVNPVPTPEAPATPAQPATSTEPKPEDPSTSTAPEAPVSQGPPTTAITQAVKIGATLLHVSSIAGFQKFDHISIDPTTRVQEETQIVDILPREINTGDLNTLAQEYTLVIDPPATKTHAVGATILRLRAGEDPNPPIVDSSIPINSQPTLGQNAKDDIPLWAIILACAGCVLLVAGAAFGVRVYYRRKQAADTIVKPVPKAYATTKDTSDHEEDMVESMQPPLSPLSSDRFAYDPLNTPSSMQSQRSNTSMTESNHSRTNLLRTKEQSFSVSMRSLMDFSAPGSNVTSAVDLDASASNPMTTSSTDPDLITPHSARDKEPLEIVTERSEPLFVVPEEETAAVEIPLEGDVSDIDDDIVDEPAESPQPGSPKAPALVRATMSADSQDPYDDMIASAHDIVSVSDRLSHALSRAKDSIDDEDNPWTKVILKEYDSTMGQSKNLLAQATELLIQQSSTAKNDDEQESSDENQAE